LADAGMSTTPEAQVANQLKLPCAAVSVITDECDPDHLNLLILPKLLQIAGTSDEKLSQLFLKTIHSIV
jgi:purine-nucleoside phosphorylase